MGGNGERKFRNLFIGRSGQFKIIMTSLVYMFVIFIVTLGVVLFPLLSDIYFSPSLEVKYKAAQLFLVLARWLVPAITMLFTLFSLHLLLMTHRVFGPLVNFTHTFDRLGRCDFSRKVRLRRGDYLKEEGERINHMIESVAGRLQEIKSNHEKLLLALEDALDERTEPVNREKIERGLLEVNSHAKAVSSQLELFRLENAEK